MWRETQGKVEQWRAALSLAAEEEEEEEEEGEDEEVAAR